MRLAIAFLLGLGLAGCASDSRTAAEGNVTAPAAAPPLAAPEGTKGPVAGRLDRSHAGEPAPDHIFEDGQGRPTSMAAFRGRPALVNLWATWCAPCVAELPTLDALAAREAGALSVITVSQDSDGAAADGTPEPAAAKVDAFFTKMKFAQLGAYLDAESAIMTQLGISILPTTILYDAAGKEVWRMTGELDWTGPRAAKLIGEAG